MKKTSATSTKLSIAAIPITTFSLPKGAIQGDVVINKQDLVKDKSFHLTEPFSADNCLVHVFVTWFESV